MDRALVPRLIVPGLIVVCGVIVLVARVTDGRADVRSIGGGLLVIALGLISFGLVYREARRSARRE